MEFIRFITISNLILVAGIVLFTSWLLRTSLGKNALADSVPRRNDMPIYLPFIVLFLALQFVPVTAQVVINIIGNLPKWQNIFLNNLIIGIGEIISIILIVILAWIHFPRRLNGFGLNIKTIFRDFCAAAVNLLAVWPLIVAATLVTVSIGELISGKEYHLQQHEQLKTISENPQLPLQITVIVVAVVIAPLLEEMLFRGLFQTMLRSLIQSFTQTRYAAWLAILVSSVLFVFAHVNTGHWPALFVLAACLGYSYEKSGSLLRPIFIHAIFNAISIITTLSQ